MRTLPVRLLAVSLALSSSVASGTAAAAAPRAPDPAAPTAPALAAAEPAEVDRVRSDEVSNPYEDKRRALREQALNLVLNGQARPEKRGASTVVRLSGSSGPSTTTGGRFAELRREKVDKVFVVLAEFGNERHPDFPDIDTDPATPGPVVFDGPMHNAIPEPDRSVDNSTIWQPNYDRAHFERLYFARGSGVESLAEYYRRQSSGRYTVAGTVTDWVKVRYNQARYGRNLPPSGNDSTPHLIRDALAQWVADQRSAGRTDAQIRAELAAFDEWDRYDYDNDGNFDERDGYIDHFQIVHAGDSESNGDPLFGEDAIWSHRSYAFRSDAGRTGPEFNLRGGAPFGDLGIWAGDYTVQPENGGLGVFAHEFGHDLGLPDHYDTSGGGENSVNWWTLMGQSRYSAATDQAIGTRAADLGAWDKLQLGWLDYEVAVAGQSRRLVLGPHESTTANAQALVVTLPKKSITTEYGKPAAGSKMWWGGKANNLDNTLTRAVDLTGAAAASASLKARFETEAGFDFVYAQTSTDGGATWTSLDGTVDGRPFGRDPSGAPVLDGSSGGKWVDVTIPLTEIVGKQALFRLRYVTDSGLVLDGFFADEIMITADGVPIVQDGAETDAHGWTVNGFTAMTGTVVRTYDHYYIASNREYIGYDKYLKSGPYNFGFSPAKPDLVEHFPYQSGLLVTYWDTSQLDNNTSKHPGQGRILPVDAHPEPVYNLNGVPWRARIQAYDAPFGLHKAGSLTLHLGGKPNYLRGRAGEPVFDDTRAYWDPVLPFAGVKLPATGVGLRVVAESGTTVTVELFKK